MLITQFLEPMKPLPDSPEGSPEAAGLKGVRWRNANEIFS